MGHQLRHRPRPATGPLIGNPRRPDPNGATHGLLWRRPLIPALVGVIAFLLSGYLCTVVAHPVFGASVVTIKFRSVMIRESAIDNGETVRMNSEENQLVERLRLDLGTRNEIRRISLIR